MRRAAGIGLVGCAGSAAVIGWIPHLLLWLVMQMQTSTFGSFASTGGLREGEDGLEPRLEPCCTMLVISSLKCNVSLMSVAGH